jgi:hypothetical protein
MLLGFRGTLRIERRGDDKVPCWCPKYFSALRAKEIKMNRTDQIYTELDHFKLEEVRITHQINLLLKDMQFVVSRIALLLTELAKLRSEEK